MSHSCQIYNADGTLALDTDERFPRVIWWGRFLSSTSTTISIPEFSDTKGFLTRQPAIIGDNYHELFLNMTHLCNVNWNEANKELAITPHTGTPNSYTYNEMATLIVARVYR